MLEKFNEMCTKNYVKLQLAKSDVGNSIRNEKGAVAVEYGIVIAVVVVAIVAAAAALGGHLGPFFQEIADTLIKGCIPKMADS